jgi:hypothetical protein
MLINVEACVSSFMPEKPSIRKLGTYYDDMNGVNVRGFRVALFWLTVWVKWEVKE